MRLLNVQCREAQNYLKFLGTSVNNGQSAFSQDLALEIFQLEGLFEDCRFIKQQIFEELLKSL